MIKVINVNKFFNKNKVNEIHVINNANFELENNGLVAILGESGSGKTTLLNAIGGLDKVNKGNIYVNNKKITSKSANKKDKIRALNIGYIFQDYKLINSMTVYENVALVLKMIGIKDKQEIKRRVDYVLNSVNMYRYRNRPAEMLSGGERQRVGIARAIVKNPEIIIADEPTGNLDSKNSIQIMNIIKAISREKLVILVTHEIGLAKFYASRILEIKDGKIEKDYENAEIDELDYGLDHKIFLKDLTEQKKLEESNINVEYFSDNSKTIDIKIIVKNGNIYIKSNKKENIEILNENSNIELVNDHYKKLDKEIYKEYIFDFDKNINKNLKQKYSSIFNPVLSIINGFKKIFGFSLLKKALLIGFLISGMFSMYAVSSTIATLNTKDEKFVKYNTNYFQILNNSNDIDVDEFLKYEKNENIKYILPGSSITSFTIRFNDYYQTEGAIREIRASISDINLITENNLICGRMPQNDYEVVLDKLAIKDSSDTGIAKMVGISKDEDYLNRYLEIENMDKFKIVGITDLVSPSIYVKKEMMINIISNNFINIEREQGIFSNIFTGNIVMGNFAEEQENIIQYVDYKLYENKIELKEGNYPVNDYETIVDISNKELMPLNKELDKYIVNGKKLKVVGYYTSNEYIDKLLVNNNVIKFNLINKAKVITVCTDNINQFLEKNLTAENAYEKSKNEYLKEMKDERTGNLIFAGIVLGISLIEVYLMTRSSFLSRIKEIGIFRAIGIKKIDIYKMFSGEIIAISTIGSLPGIIFMAYILKAMSLSIEYFEDAYFINGITVLGTICAIYIFNLIIGLLPVFNVIRKTPAEILSRNDI